jgi:hypothetical protein
MTRGDVLRYNIAYALIHASKIVRGVRQGLTEDERYRHNCQTAVDQLARKL